MHLRADFLWRTGSPEDFEGIYDPLSPGEESSREEKPFVVSI
jgi:hypothetical protein